jgi:mRNA interferase RelE/StbE
MTLRFDKSFELEGWRGYFRVRLGDYRLGCRLDAGSVVAVRFLHRRDIYQRFP